jgi:hypothetical protein
LAISLPIFSKLIFFPESSLTVCSSSLGHNYIKLL